MISSMLAQPAALLVAHEKTAAGAVLWVVVLVSAVPAAR